MKRNLTLLLLLLTTMVGTAQTCTENCKTCTAPKCVRQTANASRSKTTAKQQTPMVEILYFHG